MPRRGEHFNFSQEATDIATGRVFGSAYDIWEDIYELIIKDYISDVYSDVIETFLGASIKVERMSRSFEPSNTSSCLVGPPSGRSWL